jgi:hypothetical protein
MQYAFSYEDSDNDSDYRGDFLEAKLLRLALDTPDFFAFYISYAKQPSCSLDEAAESLGMTRQGVRQTEIVALYKIWAQCLRVKNES